MIDFSLEKFKIPLFTKSPKTTTATAPITTPPNLIPSSSMSAREKGVNVQVLLRCRPFSKEELRIKIPQVVTCNDYTREVSISHNNSGKQFDKIYTFDKVFGPAAKQQDLFEQAVFPIVNEVLEGFNCTIFAYGQTGTGKTYTMEGECRKSRSAPSGELPEDAGVIPRAVKQIFETLESQNAEYSVKVTFLELYNEEITDLLVPEELSKVSLEEKQKKLLPLMEDGKGGVLVKGLEEEIVTSATEIFTLLERGSAKRRTAETLLNKQSSRSHSLFSITIHIREATPEGEELIKCGKLNLVGLAGSENISRSSVREGRAREAGEINKSLLTLGRVITALVEHMGHVPYRDSKLTRLLRDSLGGRTKTCIIATVSPAVHCLEETLSTLDYAHRAKNIKNKPEVNQKMMKSTLIKDLYMEIERLKGELDAAREKNGVFLPKERDYQDETERKTMAEKIEQMTVTHEAQEKILEELQEKIDAQLQQNFDLTRQLDSIQMNLNQTSTLAAIHEDELKKCRSALKEKDFVISKQKKAENALVRQACVLRSDLEKSLLDYAKLHSKLDREEKLHTENRTEMDTFQAELAQNVGCLSNLVTALLSGQNEHLNRVEKHCKSFMEMHNKALLDIKMKVTASRDLYISHFWAVQNVVSQHKAISNSCLEEILLTVSSDKQSVDNFLDREGSEVNLIFDDLQSSISTQQEVMCLFGRELHERLTHIVEQMKGISEYLDKYLSNILQEARNLGTFTTNANETNLESLTEFQKAFEEQLKSDAEKLLSEVTSLVFDNIKRQKELVGARLNGLRKVAIGNKEYFDGLVSLMEEITCETKEKWSEFSVHSVNHCNDNVDLCTANESQVQEHLKECTETVDGCQNKWESVHTSVSDINSRHVSTVTAFIRNASDFNEHLDREVHSAQIALEENALKNNEELQGHIDGESGHEQECISRILDDVRSHTNTLQTFCYDHSGQTSAMNEKARETFLQTYSDNEPSGTTPGKCEVAVPSKEEIESQRAMPMELLLEEFRENLSSNQLSAEKEPRPSLIPRSPLTRFNS